MWDRRKSSHSTEPLLPSTVSVLLVLYVFQCLSVAPGTEQVTVFMMQTLCVSAPVKASFDCLEQITHKLSHTHKETQRQRDRVSVQ